jgi:hypothetical protein
MEFDVNVKISARQFNENVSVTLRDKLLSPLDITLELKAREVIRLLKGFGGQYLFYSPEKVKEMEDDLISFNDDIEI